MDAEGDVVVVGEAPFDLDHAGAVVGHPAVVGLLRHPEHAHDPHRAQGVKDDGERDRECRGSGPAPHAPRSADHPGYDRAAGGEHAGDEKRTGYPGDEIGAHGDDILDARILMDVDAG